MTTLPIKLTALAPSLDGQATLTIEDIRFYKIYSIFDNIRKLDTTCAYLCLSTATTSFFLFRFSSSGINICCTSPLVDIRKLYTVTLGRTSNLTTFAQVGHP